MLTAARQAFVEAAGRADEVTLDGIARAAGVGIGTLYRNFPTRGALVEAVYRAELDDLDDLAGRLVSTGTARDALGAWTRRYAEFVTTKRGMRDAFAPAMDAGRASPGPAEHPERGRSEGATASGSRPEAAGGVRPGETRARITAALAVLLEAGAVDGTLRGDVAADDVTTALVGAFLATADQDDPDRVMRVIDLVLAGLSPARAE